MVGGDLVGRQPAPPQHDLVERAHEDALSRAAAAQLEVGLVGQRPCRDRAARCQAAVDPERGPPSRPHGGDVGPDVRLDRAGRGDHGTVRSRLVPAHERDDAFGAEVELPARRAIDGRLLRDQRGVRGRAGHDPQRDAEVPGRHVDHGRVGHRQPGGVIGEQLERAVQVAERALGRDERLGLGGGAAHDVGPVAVEGPVPRHARVEEAVDQGQVEGLVGATPGRRVSGLAEHDLERASVPRAQGAGTQRSVVVGVPHRRAGVVRVGHAVVVEVRAALHSAGARAAAPGYRVVAAGVVFATARAVGRRRWGGSSVQRRGAGRAPRDQQRGDDDGQVTPAFGGERRHGESSGGDSVRNERRCRPKARRRLCSNWAGPRRRHRPGAARARARSR